MQEKKETKEPQGGQEESALQEKKVLAVPASMGRRWLEDGGDRDQLRQRLSREGTVLAFRTLRKILCSGNAVVTP